MQLAEETGLDRAFGETTPEEIDQAFLFWAADVHRALWPAEELDMEFLGEIPLDIAIRETSDAGTPITVTQPDSPHAQAYRQLADRVAEKLAGGAGRQAPRIVVQ